MLPNFFILGAAKCGTSALNFYLSQHPQFAMARPKEPPFFAAQYEQGLSFYETTCFAHCNGEAFVGDAAHRNLYLPYVPERIFESVPDAKFVVLLRNPIERAYSHYWHDFTHSVREASFEDCLDMDLRRMEQGPSFDDPESYQRALNDMFETPDYPTFLDTGHYAEQIERYWKLFGRERMHIAFFEDLVADTAQVVEDVVSFLGAEPFRADDLSPQNQAAPQGLSRFFEVVGQLPLIETVPYSWRDYVKRKLRRFLAKPKPSMNEQTRQWLGEYYRPQVKALEQLTGFDLSRWQV